MRHRQWFMGAICALCLAAVAQARLGETLAQMQARLGPGKPAEGGAALLAGAEELEFKQERWQLRAAFVLASDGARYCLRERFTAAAGTFSEAATAQYLQEEAAGSFWVEANFTSPIVRWRRGDGAVAEREEDGARLDLEHPQAARLAASKAPPLKALGVALLPGAPAPPPPTPVKAEPPKKAAAEDTPLPAAAGGITSMKVLRWLPWVGLLVMLRLGMMVAMRRRQ